MSFGASRPTMIAVSCCLLPAMLLAAEIQVSEALLRDQEDRVTITIVADVSVFDHSQLRKRGHVCDQHVVIEPQQSSLSWVGDIERGCHSDGHYWGLGGTAKHVTGVFRLWLERHPPGYEGAAILCHTDGTSTLKEARLIAVPKIFLGIHPILSIGDVDLVSELTSANLHDRAGLYSTKALVHVLQKSTVLVQRVQIGSDTHLRIASPRSRFQHFALRGRLVHPPIGLPDGQRLHLEVLDGTKVVADALPAVTILGSEADVAVQELSVGDEFDFQALLRLDVSSLLDEATDAPQRIPSPVELVILGFQQR